MIQRICLIFLLIAPAAALTQRLPSHSKNKHRWTDKQMGNGETNQFTRSSALAFMVRDVQRRMGDSPDNALKLLLTDAHQKEELLAYAKSLLLSQLGLGERVTPPPDALNTQRACFVTFFHGRRVIACSGSFYPRTANLAREIEENIRQALAFDPRARIIDPKKAVAADVQITFPREPQAISSVYGFDPSREGLFVETDHLGVAIVPGEAKTASWALREALRRLGQPDPTRVRLFKFEAVAISTRD
jgi:hypothetical protein